jgi:hypothetical protein
MSEFVVKHDNMRVILSSAAYHLLKYSACVLGRAQSTAITY